MWGSGFESQRDQEKAKEVVEKAKTAAKVTAALAVIAGAIALAPETGGASIAAALTILTGVHLSDTAPILGVTPEMKGEQPKSKAKN